MKNAIINNTRHTRCDRVSRFVEVAIDTYRLDEDLPLIKGAIADGCAFGAPSLLVILEAGNWPVNSTEEGI